MTIMPDRPAVTHTDEFAEYGEHRDLVWLFATARRQALGLEDGDAPVKPTGMPQPQYEAILQLATDIAADFYRVVGAHHGVTPAEARDVFLAA